MKSGNSNDDDIEDDQDIVYNLDTFDAEDLKRCLNLIADLSSVSENNNSKIDPKIETICETFDALISKWQTNPKLIETHLTQLLAPIIDIITKSEMNSNKFNASFQLIQRLISCIGPKSVGRYFPTEVLWLTKLIDWCERQTSGDSNSWQTRSVLFLWLSTSVKTPFHLRKFDSSNETENTVSERIYRLIDNYLKVSDKSRDSAALLAANFFSRPDMIELQMLNRFMEESFIQMNSHFGHVIAMAVLFKLAKRTDIMGFGEKAIELGSKLDTCGHELVTKWKIKLIGRSALSLMSPRIAKWRYKRGRRLLSQNISIQMSNVDQIESIQSKDSFPDNEEDVFYGDIPEQIELIIDSLLNGLQDSNTIVRWSAAKYISRLTNRFPKELAADVVTHVLQLHEWKRSDSSWHGCCLALAELARRGLILTDQLPQVVALVEKALVFDELKGAFSVGANVRDAACFVCWSLSRAYESDEIQKFVNKLAPVLVCVTCFDREVNCRRAASAAIQEFAGRTQVFPHGLEVLVLTDFHLLANRSHCYLDIALKLSQKQEFGKSLFEYLISNCNHWDRDIRELVAQSMGRLSVHIDINPYFNELLSKSTSLDLNSRHGSILSIAHIIGNIGPNLKPEYIEGIESIATVLSEKKLLRGMGGELMKQALSVLIGKCSSVSLPVKTNIFDVWIEVICDSIASEDSKTRKDAIPSLPVFCKNYLQNETLLKDRVLTQILSLLSSSKESSRIGSSESLRLMSKEFLSIEYFNQCFDTIVTHIRSGDSLCFSRSSEVMALIDLSLEFLSLEDTKIQIIVECLCIAFNDRTTDSRGDIGGNVRLAAIEASLLFIEHLDDNHVIKILKLISTQCLSVWQKERISAVSAFKQIVFNRELDQINRQVIKSFFDISEEETDWKPFIQLLRVELFTYDLWRGLVKCVANPTETRVRNLLKQELKSAPDYVLQQFLILYENNLKNDLSKSCVNCSYFLLSSCRTSEEFCRKVLTLTWNCVRRSRDCRKIIAAIDVFCAGFQFSVFKQSLSYLTVLLCHSFPRIRCQTANQMYVALLTVDDINEDVTNLLTETDWTSGPLERLKPIRDQICDALGVAKPIKISTTSKT